MFLWISFDWRLGFLFVGLLRGCMFVGRVDAEGIGIGRLVSVF